MARLKRPFRSGKKIPNGPAPGLSLDRHGRPPSLIWSRPSSRNGSHETSVDGRTFKVLRHAYLTDTFCDRVAFCRQLTSRKLIVEGGAHWIVECDLHIGIAFLEGARNSTQSAAATDGAGEAVDLSVSLLPNFRASRAIVAIAVGDVVDPARWRSMLSARAAAATDGQGRPANQHHGAVVDRMMETVVYKVGACRNGEGAPFGRA